MARRGRPPYPDILTPREFEVLALLREGLSNEEIAERLGVTLAGAKYHVSEILSKLGVSSREEAARWEPEERPWWAGALAPVAWLRRSLGVSMAARAVALGLALVVVAGVALLAWGLVRTEGDGSSEGAEVIPSATVRATPAGPVVLQEGVPLGVDWSSDSSSIVFATGGALYRTQGPAFAVHQVLPAGEEYGQISEPRWDADGNRIAFLGSHKGRGGDASLTTNTIWLTNTNGSYLRDLLPGEKAELSVSTGKVMQDWLGNYTLAFDEHCGTGCQHPYLLDVESGEMEDVAPANSETGPPGAPGTVFHYSPDWRWVAIESMGTFPQMVLYDRQTRQLSTLLPRGEPPPWQWFSSWAPDSSAFLYEQAESDGGSFSPPFSLYRFDVETKESRLVATPGKDGAWSREGTRIAYVTEATPDRPCEGSADCIAVIDAATKEELYRVPGPGEAVLRGQNDAFRHPWFLPNGRLLYNDFQGSVWRASNGQRRLLFHTNAIIALDVSGKAHAVAVTEPGRLVVVPIPPG